MPLNRPAIAAPGLPAKPRWAWRYRGTGGAFEGTVIACDPRDATARALTTGTADCRLFGDAHAVPMDVLHAAPGNADPAFRFDGPDFSFEVSRISGVE